jgi:uncharacterized protein with von Willebrand factor type A (vWA) domain
VLVKFFLGLRAVGVPVTVTEFLTLLQALRARVAAVLAQDFYFLARTCLVKDERYYDRFDRAFAAVFEGDFVYESVWKDNPRHSTVIPLSQIIRTYGRDYCVIFVGDALMSPYEITLPGGSIEHWNREAGAEWMHRLTGAFPRLLWLNPQSREHWAYSASTGIVRELVGDRMFPLTIEGLERGMMQLRRAQPLPPAPASP